MNAQIFNTLDQKGIGVHVDHYVNGNLHSSRSVSLTLAEAQILLKQLARAIEVASLHVIPAYCQDDASFAEWLNNYPDMVKPALWQDLDSFESDGYGVALLTSHKVPTEQVDTLARYYFEGPFAGEYYNTKCVNEVDGQGTLFLLNTDFTKSRHDDWTEYIAAFWPHMEDGSPIRKTNRSGPETKGTRAVEGLHCEIWVAFE